MNQLSQISEAEFEVMKVVWKYAPISTNDVTEKLTRTTNWSPKTIIYPKAKLTPYASYYRSVHIK